MKVENGLVELKFNGVKNLQTIGEMVREKAEKYRGIVVTEDTLKECKETLEEIKPVRADIKKVRASVNKELTALVKGQLQEIDNITNILTEVIEPIENGIEFFEEQKRMAKIEMKKNKYLPLIQKINEELKKEELPYFYNLNLLEWKDEMANKSEIALQTDFIEFYELQIKDINSKKDRIKLIVAQCKLLQLEWSLETDINWQYLRSDIYLDNWIEKLEDLAAHQQTQEMQIKENEKLRIEKEEEEKRKEIERKHQQEMQVKEKEIEVIKEQVAEVKQVVIPASDNKKEFKVRIDCVLSAESFEQIETFIKSAIITDKIIVSEIGNKESVLRQLERLEERSNWLGYLEACGVDNWAGYEIAQKMYQEEE